MTTFSYSPDFGATATFTPTVKSSKFGDGYQQRQAYGINNIVESWNLKFTVREDTDANAILAFFVAAGGVTTFDWTNPNGDTGKYICSSWSPIREVALRKSISATFERAYEP